jgi:ABC-type glycerol-3-phosphate transport system substrate-binding protein
MKKRKVLFGIAALAFAAMVVLGGCAKKFDGSSLVGTTWVGESGADLSSYGAGKYTATVTAKFNSDTAGAIEIKVTKYEGNWPDEWKTKVQGIFTEQSGDFTYTYNADEHTGSAKTAQSSASFTVDVSAKTLTYSTSGGEIVLKLK